MPLVDLFGEFKTLKCITALFDVFVGILDNAIVPNY
jgi:hypothetical protein